MRTVYCPSCEILYLDTIATHCPVCGYQELLKPDHFHELRIRSAVIRLHTTQAIVNESVSKGLMKGSSYPNLSELNPTR